MFKTSNLLDEQVEAHLNRLRRNGWLTFKGIDAVEMLRRVIFLKGQPPILIAHCHQQLATEPLDYANFIPRHFSHNVRGKLVTITGTLGPSGEEHKLFYAPNNPVDGSGQFLSSISTLESCFPRAEIEAIQIPALHF
ncbi:MAG: hypothetical protein KGS72_22510 [Cyanobacteria bacterium REEB67]|nr:hypothetical protein [Cyanobacteria bacterium REEB67]